MNSRVTYSRTYSSSESSEAKLEPVDISQCPAPCNFVSHLAVGFDFQNLTVTSSGADLRFGQHTVSGGLDPDPDPDPDPEPEPELPPPEPLSSEPPSPPLVSMGSAKVSIIPYICELMFGMHTGESVACRMSRYGISLTKQLILNDFFLKDGNFGLWVASSKTCRLPKLTISERRRSGLR